jgi:TolB protein
MLRRLISTVLSVCALITAVCAIKIEIAGGNVEPEPIAIVELNNDADVQEMVAIISKDLEQSGLFRVVNQSCEACTIKLEKPQMQHWKQNGARYLLLMHNTREFTVLDTTTGAILLKSSTNVRDRRRASHDVADQTFKRITNEDGYFNTHIVHVETVPGTKTTKRLTRLVLVDQDGFNRVELTDDKKLYLTPRACGEGPLIACVVIDDKARDPAQRVALAKIVDVKTRSVRPVLTPSMLKALSTEHHGKLVQMSYAPRLSPDGGRAVLAIAIGGNSAIYEVNYETGTMRQLTALRCIDTSPSYSHDGKHIIFTSDREGREAIFKMDADGSNVERLSHGEGKYSQPVCSPRGDFIAATKQYKGQFFIVIMKVDGTCERCIASGGLTEAPSWAPNGRYIAYALTHGTQSRVVVVDTTGRCVRVVPTKHDASSPTWLPALFTH